MSVKWILTLWDGTEVSRQVPDLAEAVNGYDWDDITKVRVVDIDGIDRRFIAYNWDEAARYAELATNVAEKYIWMQASKAFNKYFRKLKMHKIKEVTIL